MCSDFDNLIIVKKQIQTWLVHYHSQKCQHSYPSYRPTSFPRVLVDYIQLTARDLQNDRLQRVQVPFHGQSVSFLTQPSPARHRNTRDLCSPHVAKKTRSPLWRIPVVTPSTQSAPEHNNLHTPMEERLPNHVPSVHVGMCAHDTGYILYIYSKEDHQCFRTTSV